jgi:hypothetical protein
LRSNVSSVLVLEGSMKRLTLGAIVLLVAGVVGGAASCGPHNRNDIAGTFDLAGTDIDPNTIDFSGFPQPTDDMYVATHDPATCAEAQMSKSYIGCDYWPTVTGNAVWSVFDYAVVVSNPGMTMANITVTGGALSAMKTQQVPPGQLVKIPLPWVTALKGPDADANGASMGVTNSVKAAKGAYHLVSDVPVLVYQFNALEYKSGSGNNLNGVAWSTCPPTAQHTGVPCYSFSNDASLLLPSTAMTPNYVVTGIPGDDLDVGGMGSGPQAIGSSYVSITGTVDGTTVTMQLSKTGDILASMDSSIAAVAQNATTPAKVMYTINAGDVLQLTSGQGSGHDLTGSIIEASQPVQVMVGVPCTTNPTDYLDPPVIGNPSFSCDHIEETVLPVETWGKSYGVTAPTGPDATKQKHSVRIYGGTAVSNLTVTPSVAGVPSMIAPGQVVKFDTDTDFVIIGDKEFAISTEQMSAEVITQPAGTMPQDSKGDPSISFFAAIEQYRDKYLFLAPTDYDLSFVDIVVKDGTHLMLDGAAVTTAPTSIGGGYSSLRLPLPAGSNLGAHTLTGDAPFGIQVIGYGSQTSYQYPGGLDLKVIAPPPPIL